MLKSIKLEYYYCHYHFKPETKFEVFHKFNKYKKIAEMTINPVDPA